VTASANGRGVGVASFLHTKNRKREKETSSDVSSFFSSFFSSLLFLSFFFFFEQKKVRHEDKHVDGTRAACHLSRFGLEFMPWRPTRS